MEFSSTRQTCSVGWFIVKCVSVRGYLPTRKWYTRWFSLARFSLGSGPTRFQVPVFILRSFPLLWGCWLLRNLESRFLFREKCQREGRNQWFPLAILDKLRFLSCDVNFAQHNMSTSQPCLRFASNWSELRPFVSSPRQLKERSEWTSIIPITVINVNVS